MHRKKPNLLGGLKAGREWKNEVGPHPQKSDAMSCTCKAPPTAAKGYGISNERASWIVERFHMERSSSSVTIDSLTVWPSCNSHLKNLLPFDMNPTERPKLRGFAIRRPSPSRLRDDRIMFAWLLKDSRCCAFREH